MESGMLTWLDSVGATSMRWSALAFVLINGFAIAAVALTRDRTLVNRWTGRLLAANLVLAGTGFGIPLLTSVTRLAATVVLRSTREVAPIVDPSEDDAGQRQEVELLPRN